jgi:glucose-1-phosphate cytidylyltransferase
MKVVLFCGGLGMRLREYSDKVPKPMAPIGYRPILWHVMKYYAHFGHKEFILCLGYKADVIKNYFLHYDECMSNDFILSKGGTINLINSDIQDWQITFVDTGIDANIGERLKAVECYLEDDEVFLANYSDGLTDLRLPTFIDFFTKSNKTACFLCTKPIQSFHVVALDDSGIVHKIDDIRNIDININGGYFIFKKDIFKYLKEGEELVYKPFQRLIAHEELIAYRHHGFWACMDTLKDKQLLEEMYAHGHAPWAVWTSVRDRQAY